MKTKTLLIRTHHAMRQSLIMTFCLALIACNPSKPTTPKELLTSETSQEAQTDPQTNTAEQAKISPELILELEAKLLDAAEQANILNTVTDTFLASPSEQAHSTLLEAYQRAHQSYRLAAAVLFLASGQTTENLAIDAAPMLPGYLDSVEGYPNSGLIHSEMNLDLNTLKDEHQFSDQLYLTLGFHPFEFILQGDPSSPIAAWRRFVSEGTEKQKSAAQRRTTYLSLLANNLRSDIRQQALLWQKTKSVRKAFLNDPRIMEDYLEKEKEHSGEAGAERIKAFWLSLDALQDSASSTMTEEEPESTLPSDSSSQE